MISLSKEEIKADQKLINKGRSALKRACWYEGALRSMLFPHYALGAFRTLTHTALFYLDGIIYWYLAIGFLGKRLYDEDGLGYLIIPIIWAPALALRLVWRFSRKAALTNQYKKIFEEINTKYQKIKNDWVYGLLLNDGYQVVTNNADAARQTYKREKGDTTRIITLPDRSKFSFVPLGGFCETIGEMDLKVHTYRDFGQITIKRFVQPEWRMSEERFLTGINMFDMDYEVMANDEIKAKSFLNPSLINSMVEKSAMIKELDPEGKTITVDGDEVKTNLPFEPLFDGLGFDVFADTFDFKYKMKNVNEFLEKMNTFEESYNKTSKIAEEFEKMIRSERYDGNN